MAQLVERVLGKDEVTGSNPVSSSIKEGNPSGFPFFDIKQKLSTFYAKLFSFFVFYAFVLKSQ